MKNYAITREYRLKRLYGITRAEYDAMFEAQGGTCAICAQPETALANSGQVVRDLCVDHCHDSGRVRGLLCARCNSAVGLLFHDEQLLLSAITYLKET